MKVGGKLFAIIADEADPLTISVKCEPDIAVMLRAHYPAVGAGYHLNKRHWNTVILNGTIPKREIFEWIDDSYDLVVEGLPRATRDALRGEETPPQ